MNAVSRMLTKGKIVPIRRVSTPVHVDLGDLDALRMEGRILWVGNSMRVLVGAELRPVRIKKSA